MKNPFHRHLTTFALLIALLPGASAAQIPPVLCVGDCNNDRFATIDELVIGVGIATGRMPPGACLDFDPSRDGDLMLPAAGRGNCKVIGN